MVESLTPETSGFEEVRASVREILRCGILAIVITSVALITLGMYTYGGVSKISCSCSALIPSITHISCKILRSCCTDLMTCKKETKIAGSFAGRK